MKKVYLLALHVLLAVLVWKTDAVAPLRIRLSASDPEAATHVAHMVAYHRAMDPSVPDGAALFLGDSITQSLATAAVAPHSINYGIGFATTRDLLAHMPVYRSLSRASVVFLMIGVNDLLMGRNEGLHDRLRQMALALPADRKLVWSGIMPVTSGQVPREQIAAANEVIRAACATRPRCSYVDTTTLLGDDRSLMRDGVHPNEQGYARWIAALKAAAETPLAPG